MVHRALERENPGVPCEGDLEEWLCSAESTRSCPWLVSRGTDSGTDSKREFGPPESERESETLERKLRRACHGAHRLVSFRFVSFVL